MARLVGVFIGIVVSSIGFVLHVVGLATPKWTVDHAKDHHSGLWERCSPKLCEHFALSQTEAWLHVSKAFALLGVAAGLMTIVSSISHGIYLTSKMCMDIRKVPAVLGVITFACVITCVCVFGIHMKSPVGFSLIIDFIGGFLMFVGACIVTVLGKPKSDNDDVTLVTHMY
ncbi:unnamed protein product [Lymnaea stagnalis]|uniref:Uncharacterized protein n=1 Tax=Lymnaea stagnalis TaxID=6523 RepID=A0AAV2HHH7_LYMST